MKWFSLLKILVICFLLGGESSYDSVFIFLCYFFNRSSSLNYSYFLGGGTGRGAGRERRKIHEGGARHSHVTLLSTAETASFFETFFSFFRGKLLGLSLVSMSMALGSLEVIFLVGVGVWNASWVLDECCLVTKATKCH